MKPKMYEYFNPLFILAFLVVKTGKYIKKIGESTENTLDYVLEKPSQRTGDNKNG